MPSRVLVAIAVLLALGPMADGRAAIETSTLPRPRMQLLVIEVPGCFYCRLFRRDVLPAYEATAHAQELPMRFVDVSAIESRSIELSRPIEMVPTIILMRGGREVGRLPGYPNAQIFLRSIRYLISLQR